MSIRYCLLTDPMIRVRIGGSVQRLTLPELLAALARDEVEALPALRPHQRHAVHMFLAMLAALALLRAEMTEPPLDPNTWSTLLRALAPEAGDAAWTLVVDDVTKPAFLQSPAIEGTVSIYLTKIATPDQLDLLVTARNHDLKVAVANEAEPDDWLFALISLQTMEGYSGSGHYGISRMNDAYSTRSFLGLTPPGGMGAHILRDARGLLAGRSKLSARYPDLYDDQNGTVLVWLLPWDGTRSLRMQQLDPWYIEICRRVRLYEDSQGRLRARRVTGTDTPRIDAKALTGRTGDFWAPIDRAKGKALSLDAHGFSSRVLTRLLFGEGGKRPFDLPPSFTLLAEEKGKEMRLVARGVTRGKGKTEGYHERIIPLRSATARKLQDDAGRADLGETAARQLKEIDAIAAALRFACAIVAANGETPRKGHYEFAAPYLKKLDREAESRFFDALQDRMRDEAAARADFLRRLVRTAEDLLGQATDAIPCASIHRYRARAAAGRAFHGTLWGSKSILTNDRSMILGAANAK